MGMNIPKGQFLSNHQRHVLRALAFPKNGRPQDVVSYWRKRWPQGERTIGILVGRGLVLLVNDANGDDRLAITAKGRETLMNFEIHQQEWIDRMMRRGKGY